MNKVRFDIAAWHALSPGMANQSDWAAWAANGKAWPTDPAPVAVGDIPAMMRRRMSLLSKLAIQTAMTLVQSHSVDFIVFSSRHGELHRTATLLQEVLRGEDASPIAFSQSVHNTAAGLLTIATKLAIPVTSIAAGEHSLHAALIDAAAYLAEHPTHRVLVVDFDEPLPAPYDIYEQQPHQGFALGMVITHGDQCRLQWQHARTASPANSATSTGAIEPLQSVEPLQTLAVIAQLAQQTPSWSITGHRHHWHWNVNA